MNYWFRNAVFYNVDVTTFRDLDGDGWGDLAGLRHRLDYLRGLGIDAMWLQPFFGSPWRDSGYDVSDYLGVQPRFGDLTDVATLLQEADQRGIRVIIDLVVQHTSDQHPWFRQARENPDSPYRDYYIWAPEPQPTHVEPVFPGYQRGVWARDEVSGEYYRHTFYDFEPDLNIANPRVREEIFRIMRFWLRLGVAGFRVDAAPYMVTEAAQADGRDGGQWFVRELHEQVASWRSDAVLLAEADITPKEYAAYFGGGSGFHMLFNFYLNAHYLLALTRGEAGPIVHALQAMPDPPPDSQLLVWARNHDEADLGRLSDDERAEVMAAFAPEPGMQVYGRGIRRRLPPMLGGDQQWLELAYSVMFSLPGAPVLRYGEEIGMGDDLSLPERAAVRTPMQWSDTVNGGFSSAPAHKLVAPVISKGPFGYQTVNAATAGADPHSLLEAVERMVRVRQQLSPIGTAPAQSLDVGSPAVLALLYRTERGAVLTLNNLSPNPVEVTLPADLERLELVQVLADADYEPPRPPRLRLQGRGYRWLHTPGLL